MGSKPQEESAQACWGTLGVSSCLTIARKHSGVTPPQQFHFWATFLPSGKRPTKEKAPTLCLKSWGQLERTTQYKVDSYARASDAQASTCARRKCPGCGTEEESRGRAALGEVKVARRKHSGILRSSQKPLVLNLSCQMKSAPTLKMGHSWRL